MNSIGAIITPQSAAYAQNIAWAMTFEPFIITRGANQPMPRMPIKPTHFSGEVMMVIMSA